jgi:deoxyribodipyrimidine photo-lyase
MKEQVVLFWHRRDLRITDNAGLYHALKSGYKVQPIFIYDKEILNNLENKNDARVEFINQRLHQLKSDYEKLGTSLLVWHEKAAKSFGYYNARFDLKDVYTNGDYEPYALQRDKEVGEYLAAKNIPLHIYKDHVIFEKNEVVKPDGSPYTVFTPYSKKWKEKNNNFYMKSYPVEKYAAAFHKIKPCVLMPLSALGFSSTGMNFPASKINDEKIKNYHHTRDIPSIEGTSQLSMHLRFGTISVREVVRKAITLNEKFLDELIWRDFYQMILFHFPYTANAAFKPVYDKIEWINNENQFKAWCQGKTGFPLVDAGMRQLNQTGWMHNRVRMLVASFLTKHLLIDWRWGEAYFAQKLLDYDMASNVGGWQWAAGCGNDAAPYFRIFSPDTQLKKFDPNLIYVRTWVEEFDSVEYPKPIVDHATARARALKVYKKAVGG